MKMVHHTKVAKEEDKAHTRERGIQKKFVLKLWASSSCFDPIAPHTFSNFGTLQPSNFGPCAPFQHSTLPYLLYNYCFYKFLV